MSEPIKVLDHGYVKHIASMGDDEMVIRAARQSTDGSFVSWEPYEGHPKGDAGLLSYLYKHQHMTPFEMCELVVEVQLPIFVAREWMRHRTFSYNEASARYAQMPDLHYVPSEKRMVKQATKNKQAGGQEMLDDNMSEACLYGIKSEQREVYYGYSLMLQRGLAREVARINTPVSRYTKFWCKGNLRNWLHFLGLRLHTDAQWEIREYAHAVAKIIREKWPRSWELFFEYDLHSRKLTRNEAYEFDLYLMHKQDFIDWLKSGD